MVRAWMWGSRLIPRQQTCGTRKNVKPLTVIDSLGGGRRLSMREKDDDFFMSGFKEQEK